MKRLIGITTIILVLMFGIAGIAGAQEDPKFVPVIIKIDGKIVEFPDQQPYLNRGVSRVLIPIRAVTEAMGGTVAWDDITRTVTITRNGVVVVMRLGSQSPLVNGVPTRIDATATVYNDRIVVPLRFLSQAFGAKVTWDGTTMTANVSFSSGPPTKEDLQLVPEKIDTTGMDPLLVQIVNSIEGLDTFNSSSTDIEKEDRSISVERQWLTKEKVVQYIIRIYSYPAAENDIPKMMDIFFPQSGDEAFSIIKQVYDDAWGGKGCHEVKKNIDGRSFDCFFQGNFLFVVIK